MSAPVIEEDWDALREKNRQEMPEQLAKAATLPDVLISYQSKLLATTANTPLVVCEKSRRIGMTWAVGADAVLTAGSQKQAGGMDVLYIGYNLDMAREFIDTCGMWARSFIPAASGVEEFIFKDQGDGGEEKDILAYRIKFASGFDIVALTSKPRSLRGRQGYVIFDEAAFHDELDELLKAAMAMLMWGGKVLVISTHDGQDNAFNELIQEIRSGKRAGEVVRVTFNDAINAGLYERIALVTGKPPTEEAKKEWIEEILGFYGDDADEELHVIPKASSGAYLTRAAIDACMVDDYGVARIECPMGFELWPKEKRTAFVREWLEEFVEPLLKNLDPELSTAIGEDFGRNIDLTVIAVGQEHVNTNIHIPAIVEMKNMPIEQQKQVLKFIRSFIDRFVGAKFDATGNGLGLAEWAQEEFGYEIIEAVKLSQSWYLENGPKLKGHVDDQTMFFGKDTLVRDDLRVLRLVNGIPSVPSTRKKGRHGDAAVALMMLIAALKSEYQKFDYKAVPKGGGKDATRPIRITGGFNAQKGLF